MNWRSCFRFRLLTLLIAVAVFAGLLVANTRPHSHRPLGHVSSDIPSIRPGLWISGNDFGWPWSHRTESFKTPEVQITIFDHIYPWGLAGNIGVGLLIIGAACALSELALRWWTRTSSKRA